MKKNINIIQVKGFKGIIYLALIVCCLAAGFIWFPGWACMKLWNLLSLYIVQIPQIAIIQGILLWGILAASYYTFRKEKHVVCFKAADELSEDELKEVFEDIKKQAREEMFLRSLLKTRDAELRIRNLANSKIPKAKLPDKEEKIESK